jgi:glycosyltransferase involved in cell wall biosynthesis
MNVIAGSKLLVIASLSPTCTANYFVHAFRQLGCVVKVCSDVASDLADLRVYGAVDVSRVIAQLGFEPDCVLFFEGGSMQILPVGLERVTCLTAWYGIDTHMDYLKHMRIGRLFDVSFIAQKEYVERLRTDGLHQVYWLPFGFATELMPSLMPERTIDITYVGSSCVTANPQRHVLLAELRRTFLSTQFGPATPKEMGRIYAGARLVFNKSVKNDINMRFFEATGAGAVLVTDPIIGNGVEELFEVGKHYVVYHDEDSLIQVVRDLLADPPRCAAMGESARQQVLEHHTYRHRAQSLLTTVGQSKKWSTPCSEDYFAACLSLNLLSDALRMAARAIAVPTGGSYRRHMGTLLSLALNGWARALSLIERVRFSREA